MIAAPHIEQHCVGTTCSEGYLHLIGTPWVLLLGIVLKRTVLTRHLKSLAVIATHCLRILLCVAVLAWSLAPTTGHSPRVAEVLTKHAEMVADHGHSHGLAEDLWWAIHGHHHDTVDHDHSPGVLLRPLQENTVSLKRFRWRPLMVSAVSDTPDPPRRPPRA